MGISRSAILNPIPASEGGKAPVYNLVPPPGVASKIGFVARGIVPVTIEVGVNEEPPYNVRAEVISVPQVVKFYGSELTLWGNPASPAHDAERGNCVGLSQSLAAARSTPPKSPSSPCRAPAKAP